jgi:hypothetical protein
MFTDKATYHSSYFGEYRGSMAIHAMMLDFFNRFPDAYWQISEYCCIQNNGVEFAFVMSGTDASSGEQIKRQGLERIYFTPDGRISHISVYKPSDGNN